MSRSTVQVLERPQSRTAPKEDLTQREDEDDDMDDETDGEDEESDKDDGEIELERLVFGDSAGFREGLKGSALAVREDEEDEGEATGLDGLDDADVGQALREQFARNRLLNMSSSSLRILELRLSSNPQHQQHPMTRIHLCDQDIRRHGRTAMTSA